MKSIPSAVSGKKTEQTCTYLYCSRTLGLSRLSSCWHFRHLKKLCKVFYHFRDTIKEIAHSNRKDRKTITFLLRHFDKI